MSKLRILFLGTDIHSGYILKALLDRGFNIVACVSQPDRPQGRKKQVMPTVVKEIANVHGIDVYQPENIKKDYQDVMNLDFDILLTVAYGQIIPTVLLEKARIKSINVHYSLLPKYRGATPVQSSIASGEPLLGVSIMEMVAKMDAGDVFLQESIKREKNETTTSAFAKLNAKAVDMLCEVLNQAQESNLNPQKQDESKATYCEKLTKEDEHIKLEQDVKDIFYKVKSLLDKPGGYFMVNGVRYKVLDLDYNEEPSKVGEITLCDKEQLWLGAKGGNLVIKKIQPQGKKPVLVKDFLNSNHKLQQGMKVE